MTLIQQQRLLGAVLLVCLIGVIAWFLLDTVEKNQPEQPQEEPIAFDSVIEPIPEDVEVVEPNEETLVDPEGLSQAETDTKPQQPAAPEPSSPVSKAPETPSAPEPAPTPETATASVPQPEPEPKPQPKPKPVSEPQTAENKSATAAPSSAQPQWVLQLASFSVRDNADALSNQLKQMGYDPMIETISNAGTLIYRVRLQPVTDRIKLQQTAERLSDKLKLNAQILQHNP